ncbi:MAG: hypothetical protein HOV80_05935 [Polyangiaceae bacterium]|nr:hypothetical protein [Polyangiaceae bacterium]
MLRFAFPVVALAAIVVSGCADDRPEPDAKRAVICATEPEHEAHDAEKRARDAEASVRELEKRADALEERLRTLEEKKMAAVTPEPSPPRPRTTPSPRLKFQRVPRPPVPAGMQPGVIPPLPPPPPGFTPRLAPAPAPSGRDPLKFR